MTVWIVIQCCCLQREANEVKRVVGDSLFKGACDLYTEPEVSRLATTVAKSQFSGYISQQIKYNR